MKNTLNILIFILAVNFIPVGCVEKQDTTKQQTSTKRQSDSPSDTAVSINALPSSTPAQDTNTPAINGFDLSRVPLVTPQLGKFPYLGLIEGYQPTTKKPNYNKEAAFDKYEFFDSFKIIPVEGRLVTIEAKGEGTSAFEIFKTYESLVTNLGGVKVYEGNLHPIWKRKIKFADARQRDPVFRQDQVGVYMLRTPEKEIWVEAYVSDFRNKGGYFLTVVEKQALDTRASLLAADEMKKELDAKGHVALYINFDFDKADIRPESQPIIDEIVKLLKDNPELYLTVEGHTDNVGTPDYNKRLSGMRDRSVVAALKAQGIQMPRLVAVGYGQEKPIADNNTDGGRAQNRRVELVKKTE